MKVIQVRIKPEVGVTLTMEGGEAVLTAMVDESEQDYPYFASLKTQGQVWKCPSRLIGTGPRGHIFMA